MWVSVFTSSVALQLQLSPCEPPDLAIAFDLKLVPSRRVMAVGVTTANSPAFLIKFQLDSGSYFMFY
ncbi:hypothetical protein, partial [Mesorhizobium sp. M8A.F.Ca.ET.197.01.1.1]|uniref:hypothetical protein n=1 Tax=Mesorhizobium sp. M8A.F.Ca.ET.197.01.1.1 TaxID=2563965 RepID=UPI001AEE9E87